MGSGGPKLSIGGIRLPGGSRKGSGVDSGSGESAHGSRVPKAVSAPVQPISKPEQDELAENLSEMIQGISEFADSVREAWWGGHPSKEDKPLFTLEADENAEAVEWFMRRGAKSPRMAQRIRVSTDLYESFAIPVSILFPRITTAIREIREQGFNIRGR